MDNKRKITAKGYKKALIATLLIVCLALPIIGSIELVRFARARPTSDEGRIVFLRDYSSIWVMDPDGRNEKQITNGFSDGTPSWSADESQVAFLRYTDAVNDWDIYIMNADGSDIRRLTEGPERDSGPTWSPDGKRIAFQRSIWAQNDLKNSDIYVIDVDGSNVKKLTDKPLRFEEPNWSPDGRKIAFEERDFHPENRAPQVWVMNADGSNQKMINNWGDQPAWSPDGKSIAFSSRRDWPSWDIYVMDADGANVRRLTAPGPLHSSEATWSPDGRKIAFACWEGDGWSPDKRDIYVMNADGSNVQQLTKTQMDECSPDLPAGSYAVKPAGKLKTTWGNIKHANYLESRTND